MNHSKKGLIDFIKNGDYEPFCYEPTLDRFLKIDTTCLLDIVDNFQNEGENLLVKIQYILPFEYDELNDFPEGKKLLKHKKIKFLNCHSDNCTFYYENNQRQPICSISFLAKKEIKNYKYYRSINYDILQLNGKKIKIADKNFQTLLMLLNQRFYRGISLRNSEIMKIIYPDGSNKKLSKKITNKTAKVNKEKNPKRKTSNFFCHNKTTKIIRDTLIKNTIDPTTKKSAWSLKEKIAIDFEIKE